jgi:hypothetical protein
MSSEIPPEKRAAALNDRLYAAFNDGLELIAIQAGYRFGWYSALVQNGPCTANQLSASTGTGPRFTKEWFPPDRGWSACWPNAGQGDQWR